MKENEFQKKVIQLAESLGYRVFHDYDSRRNVAGFPDLVLVNKYVIFAELKAEKGRLSLPQQEWLACLARADGVYTAVWRPSDWDDIVNVLTKLK